MDLKHEAGKTNDYLESKKEDAKRTKDRIMELAAKSLELSSKQTAADIEREIEAKVAKYRNSLYEEYSKEYPQVMSTEKRAYKDALMDFVKAMPKEEDNIITLPHF